VSGTRIFKKSLITKIIPGPGTLIVPILNRIRIIRRRRLGIEFYNLGIYPKISEIQKKNTFQNFEIQTRNRNSKSKLAIETRNRNSKVEIEIWNSKSKHKIEVSISIFYFDFEFRFQVSIASFDSEFRKFEFWKFEFEIQVSIPSFVNLLIKPKFWILVKIVKIVLKISKMLKLKKNNFEN